jgi:hypothetical protein
VIKTCLDHKEAHGTLLETLSQMGAKVLRDQLVADLMIVLKQLKKRDYSGAWRTAGRKQGALCLGTCSAGAPVPKQWCPPL